MTNTYIHRDILYLKDLLFWEVAQPMLYLFTDIYCVTPRKSEDLNYTAAVAGNLAHRV